MQSSLRCFGFGAVILAIVCSCYGAEPQKTPSPDQQAAPALFAPMAGGSNMAAKSSPFSAEISADFIKKVMETSAKIEEAKRNISERQAKLYEQNPDIKSARTLMIKKQKEINRILEDDRELADLKMNRDILWSTMPAMPKSRDPSAMPRMPYAR